MAGNKGMRSGNSYKIYYGAYKTKASEKRRARIKKHLQKHPEDGQARDALDSNLGYRRKKPIKVGGFFDEVAVKRDLGIVESEENIYPNIGPRDRHNMARARAHVLRISRRRAHGDKTLLTSRSTKSESAYAFEKEHEESVSKSKGSRKRSGRKKKNSKRKEAS